MKPVGAKPPILAIQYGAEPPSTTVWADAAAARMKPIPAFVRGTVSRADEHSSRRIGISRVTVQKLERMRADADS